ncbi:hypothetical protein ACOBR2_02995 [Telmatobacter bradus]|uniref:hypothetical protein n=1 Tax=Telmatobacter bradus TaxID=474953 RepID=UPI003B429290
MSSNLAMMMLCGVEFLLAAALALQVWKRNLYREFKALSIYLALRVLSLPVILVLLEGSMRTHATSWCCGYFFSSWGIYLVCATMLFFVCLEIFRWALLPFVGLMKYGTTLFRWFAIVSVILAISSISIHNWASLPNITSGLMRSISILELCLLAFLCICMNTLQISTRDFAFGSSLCLAFLAANDLVQSTLPLRDMSLTAASEFIYEIATLVGWGMWNYYATLPQTVRKPVVLSAASPIYRWNEIAMALGHANTKVAMQQPSSGFFLSDVEQVVEKVLARNLKKNGA